MVHLGEVGPNIWDDIMNELEAKLHDTEFKRHEITPDWRKLAHRRKFEREAFSKYGYLKDFILHPQVQLIKHYAEQNARLNDIVVGESFTSITNIVILVFYDYLKIPLFQLFCRDVFSILKLTFSFQDFCGCSRNHNFGFFVDHFIKIIRKNHMRNPHHGSTDGAPYPIRSH